MFNRSSKRRRRRIKRSSGAPVFSNAARRLRLEGMEGRLMLSTTAADFDYAPLNLTIAQFSLDSIYPAGTRESNTLTYAADANPGGFIATPYSMVPSIIKSNFEILGPPVPPVGESIIETPIFIGGGHSDADTLTPTSPVVEPVLDSRANNGSPLDGDLDSLPEVLINEPQVGGFDLKPSVFPNWDAALQGPMIESDLASVRQGPVLVDEGGLIQIEAVLSSFASLSGPESSDAIADTPAEDEPGDTRDSARLALNAPAGVDGISGELARAMAFELAGGEPAETVRETRSGRDAKAPARDVVPEPEAGEPLSSAYDETHGVTGTRVRVVRSSIVTTPGQVDDVAGPLAEIATGLRQAIQYAFDRFVGRTNGSGESRGAAVTGVAAGVDSARDEAFAELAADDAAVRSSLGVEFSLRGALNATLLLMVLALERIAVGSSRRANRDERAPSTLPLRRCANTQ